MYMAQQLTVPSIQRGLYIIMTNSATDYFDYACGLIGEIIKNGGKYIGTIEFVYFTVISWFWILYEPMQTWVHIYIYIYTYMVVQQIIP